MKEYLDTDVVTQGDITDGKTFRAYPFGGESPRRPEKFCMLRKRAHLERMKQV